MLHLDKDNELQQTTLINIFIDITTAVLERTFQDLTTNMGLVDEAKPLINMKQEFLYRRLLLTQNKKNYAGIITAELGNILPKPQLDIKGLSIKKSTIPKKLRKEFTKILEEDVLKAKSIDLKTILNKYDDLGESIEASLKSGNVEYTLPKNIETISNYKIPESIEPVRAMLLWNALEPEETIVPPEKINMLKLRADLFNGVEKIPTLNFIKDISSGKFDHLLLSAEVGNTVELSADAQTALMLYHTMTPEAWALMRDHTDKFIAIARRVFNIGETKPLIDISRFGVSCIAIPKSLGKIPEYLLPFIDYSTMVNNNMTNGYIILESLGICCEEVQTTKYKSNIISI